MAAKVHYTVHILDNYSVIINKVFISQTNLQMNILCHSTAETFYMTETPRGANSMR